jgi:acyl carrier protein
MVEPESAAVLNDIQAEIRRIIRSAAPAAHDLADDASLFEHTAVDSLAFLTILGDIERRFGLALTAADVTLTELSCIRDIASYVAQRRGAAGAA